MGSTTTQTTTMTLGNVDTVIQGFIQFLVDDPWRFINEPGVKEAIAETLSTSIGVPRKWIDVSLAIFRRLSDEGAHLRRLAGQVKASYEIRIPPVGTTTITVSATDLQKNITNFPTATFTETLKNKIKEEGLLAFEITT